MVSKKRTTMEQRLVQTNELQIGDEIIISCYSQLKYLKIVGIPKKKGSTKFKCSIKQMQRTSGNYTWGVNCFEQDITQHNKIIYQDLYERDIFLVKRENKI